MLSLNERSHQSTMQAHFVRQSCGAISAGLWQMDTPLDGVLEELWCSMPIEHGIELYRVVNMRREARAGGNNQHHQTCLWLDGNKEIIHGEQQ